MPLPHQRAAFSADGLGVQESKSQSGAVAPGLGAGGCALRTAYGRLPASARGRIVVPEALFALQQNEVEV